MNWLNYMTKQQHKNTFVEQTEAIWRRTSVQLLQKHNVDREINFHLHRSSLKKPSHKHSPLFTYIEALTKVN